MGKASSQLILPLGCIAFGRSGGLALFTVEEYEITCFGGTLESTMFVFNYQSASFKTHYP